MTNPRSIVATFAFTIVALFLFSTVHADASRAPTKREHKAIKMAALKYCAPQEFNGYKCIWKGHVRISTRNSHYAYARVSGPQYDSSGILRRKHKYSRRWKMVRVVGGGIQPCSYWYAKAPRGVVHEFKIRGFTNGDQTFTYHRC